MQIVIFAPISSQKTMYSKYRRLCFFECKGTFKIRSSQNEKAIKIAFNMVFIATIFTSVLFILLVR